MPKPIKNILFSKLAIGDPSQPFDGMAAGDFVDMYGRPVHIAAEDLPAYVANTQRNIEATRTEGGEVIGLPIDCLNHNHAEAAGWIVDVQLAADRDVVLFTPRWNELGRSLIEGDVMRFFSAEFYTNSKIITGGSLTNWPATRTKEQKILLKPITLSQSLSSIEVEESLNERVGRIAGAFQEFTGSWYVYAVQVYEDYLICMDEDEGKTYKVSFEETEEGLTFTERGSWIEVKQTYIEMALSKLGNAIESLKRVFSGHVPSDTEYQEGNNPASDTFLLEADEMTDISKLTPEQRSALLAQLTSGSDLPAELAAVIDQRANERVSVLLAAEQRKIDTAQMAGRLVGGTAESPRGLPVEKDQLTKFLLSLSPEQAEQAMSIFKTIQEKGVLEFNEVGHGREVTGALELPAEVAAKLDAGVFTLADLSSPILALGDLKQYNLSKWQGKDK
jgi:hypothetical protein